MMLDAGMRSFGAVLVVLALVAPWACQASSAGATQSMLSLLAVEDLDQSNVTRSRAVDGSQVDSSVTQALERKTERYLYVVIMDDRWCLHRARAPAID